MQEVIHNTTASFWEFYNQKRRDILKRPHSEGEFDKVSKMNPRSKKAFFHYIKQGRFLE